MSDKEIIKYYSKHINPDYGWKEIDGKLYAATPKCEHFAYCELAGSDIHHHMKPLVEEHIKNKPVRDILKKIIENG